MKSTVNDPKVKKRVPSGETRIFIKDKKTSSHICPICGKKIGGKPSLKPSKLKKLSKTKRRPTAPFFAGVICNSCVSKIVEEAIKVKTNFKKMEDVPIKYRQYVEVVIKRIEV